VAAAAAAAEAAVLEAKVAATVAVETRYVQSYCQLLVMCLFKQ
jgi:hypothetical protein